MKASQFQTRYFVFAIIIPVFLMSSALAQINSSKVSTEEELKEDLKLGPCKNGDRIEAVKNLFKRMGAAEADLKVDQIKDVQNVVLTKKGKTDETVIIGAHYDKVDAGCGIIDNWSGIVILAHLYRTLNAAETQKTYVFVAFDKEEIGLKGSSAMAKSIPKDKRSSYCSMVNLDSFGLGYPVILENASSPKMTKSAKELATELKMPITALNLEGVANADSASFKDKDIPAITLSALSNKWPQYMHSSNDKMENVITGSVRVGYHFALRYLSKIDADGCAAFK